MIGFVDLGRFHVRLGCDQQVVSGARLASVDRFLIDPGDDLAVRLVARSVGGAEGDVLAAFPELRTFCALIDAF